MRWNPSRIAGLLRQNFLLWSAVMTRSPDQFDAVVKLSLAGRRARYEELRAQRLQMSTKILAGHGLKVFSQSDEDGEHCRQPACLPGRARAVGPLETAQPESARP